MSSIKLKVAEPCHENWSNMSPADKGRFCDSCQKQVVDFTRLTDAEVANYFKKHKEESTCGRFYSTQLNTPLSAPKKSFPWARYVFTIALPALLATTKIKAQDIKGKVALDTLPKIECSPTMGTVAYVDDANKGKTRILTGEILNEDGDPIPYASVMIKGTTKGTAADAEGKFRLTVNDDKQKIILAFSVVGYETKEKKVDGKTKYLSITMKPAANELMGDVVIIAGGVSQE